MPVVFGQHEQRRAFQPCIDLVERSREQEFDEAVKALSRKYEDVLSFKYTGPWPPYNFVNIKLRLERADA